MQSIAFSADSVRLGCGLIGAQKNTFFCARHSGKAQVLTMAVSGIAIFASKLQNRPVCLPQVAKVTQHDYSLSLDSSWEANAGFPPSKSWKYRPNHNKALGRHRWIDSGEI